MQLGVFFTFVLFAHFICLALKKGKIKYKEKCCEQKKGKGSSRLSPLGILFQCTKSCSHPTIQARFSWMVVKPLISTMADTLLPSCECSLSCGQMHRNTAMGLVGQWTERHSPVQCKFGLINWVKSKLATVFRSSKAEALSVRPWPEWTGK